MSTATMALMGQAFVAAMCLFAGIAALLIGYRLFVDGRAEAGNAWKWRQMPRQGRLGAGLMLTAAAWGVLGTLHAPNLNDLDGYVHISELAPTAAGIPNSLEQVQAIATTDTLAKAAAEASDYSEAQANFNLVRLRNTLTFMLYEADSAGQYPRPVRLDLSQHADGNVIKFLVQEHPGVFTIVYQTSENENPLVYWPSIAGNQLVYTPLNDARAASELPSLSQQARLDNSVPDTSR